MTHRRAVSLSPRTCSCSAAIMFLSLDACPRVPDRDTANLLDHFRSSPAWELSAVSGILILNVYPPSLCAKRPEEFCRRLRSTSEFEDRREISGD
ncbi:hypothetical protein BD309DRAFT_957878, partial [Dichomitus squalens]